MEATITVKPTPKEMAEMLWAMYSDDHAEMFHHLEDIAEGEYNVMRQFMCVRDHCIDRKKADPRDNSLGMFQAMFSSAFRHANLEDFK